MAKLRHCDGRAASHPCIDLTDLKVKITEFPPFLFYFSPLILEEKPLFPKDLSVAEEFARDLKLDATMIVTVVLNRFSTA